MLWQLDKKGFLFNVDEADTIQRIRIEESFSEDKASKISDDIYLITHDTIANMSNDDRHLLALPEIFPYRLRISAVGALSSRSFRYRLEFIQPNGKSFINPKVIGAYICITNDLQYTFNVGQYYIVKKITEINTKLESEEPIEDLTKYNFLNFADIKEFAKSIGSELDSYLKQNKVVVPKKLSIFPHFLENGDVLVAPIILGNNGEDIPYNDDFQKRFEAREKVNTIYRGVDAFYVIKPEVEKALNEIKKHQRIKKKDVENFLKYPEHIFFSPVFDFNISDYSDRVIDIGEYKYKNSTSIKSGISWLPPEGTMFTNYGESKEIGISIENVEEIAEIIKDAFNSNSQFITYLGKTYSVTAKLISEVKRMIDVKQAKDKSLPKNESSNEKPDIEPPGIDISGESMPEARIKLKNKKYRKKILLIDDNFADVSYYKEGKFDKVINIEQVENCLNEKTTLLQHQKEGLQWLLNCYANYKGALLADDMGLGKTLQTLAFIAVVRKCLSKESQESVLVVAPVSLLNNWKEEYYKFLKKNIFVDVVIVDNLSIKDYYKGNHCNLTPIAKNYLVLTSYETLRAYQFAFGKIEWEMIILDEAQKIKNPTALSTLAIKAMKYNFGLCLTGTPVENSWIDLWSIMDFAAPGYHLGSLSEFKSEYVNKVKRNADNQGLIKELGQKLHSALHPLFKRRLKNKLCSEGLLPELPRKIIVCKKEFMPLQQKLAYESIVNSARGDEVDKKTALEVIAKLRDISLFPEIGTIDERSINNDDANRIFNSSARLKITFQELVNIFYKKEKVLIFVESKKMQRILRTVIEKFFKIKVPVAINGDMRGEVRQAVVDTFNAQEGFSVLILSPLAAGIGLNIASANHVIHLSRHWNPAKEDQATDRAYRIGQKKNVEVIIPMAIHPLLKEDSFDCKLDELLNHKRKLSEEALFPTADSAEDGLNIFSGITNAVGGTEIQKAYYDINSIDNVDGITFEKIIEELYNCAGMLANKTSDSNDNGADIVVFGNDGKDNLLIQCKKTKNIDINMGKDGVQEVIGALAFYEKMHNCKFKPVVITNTKGFTSGAMELANVNGVKLICRDELNKMLKMNPVEKIYI